MSDWTPEQVASFERWRADLNWKCIELLKEALASCRTEALLRDLLLRVRDAGKRHPDPRPLTLKGSTYEYRITWTPVPRTS